MRSEGTTTTSIRDISCNITLIRRSATHLQKILAVIRKEKNDIIIIGTPDDGIPITKQYTDTANRQVVIATENIRNNSVILHMIILSEYINFSIGWHTVL
jgi:hypothetical protein